MGTLRVNAEDVYEMQEAGLQVMCNLPDRYKTEQEKRPTRRIMGHHHTDKEIEEENDLVNGVTLDLHQLDRERHERMMYGDS